MAVQSHAGHERMKVAFRCDASHRIGSGHVMRCLTLAEALTDAGAMCEFICRQHIGHLAEQIRAKGYRCHVLEPDSEQLDVCLPLSSSTPPCKAVWRGVGA